MKFKTEVDVHLRNERIMGKCFVEWEMDLVLEVWGVRDIIIRVPDQRVRVEIDVPSDEEPKHVMAMVLNCVVDTYFMNDAIKNLTIAPTEFELMNGRSCLVFE